MSRYESFWCSGFQWMSLGRSDKFLLMLSVVWLFILQNDFFRNRSQNSDCNFLVGQTVHVYNYKCNHKVQKSYSSSVCSWDSLFFSTCYVISDLCAAFGADMLTLLERGTVQDLLTEGRRSKVMKTKTLATWATKEIKKLKNAQENKTQWE